MIALYNPQYDKMIKYSIGIDIAKKDFHVCLSTIDARQQVKVIRSHCFTNNKAGFDASQLWISSNCKDEQIPVSITLEATGSYYENCALFLFTQGYAVSVVLPNKAKQYIASLGIKTKNDKADARALSRMGAEQALDVWQPAGVFYYELRSLTRHNQSLKESRTTFTNQLEAIDYSMYPNKIVIKSIHKMIKAIDVQIEESTQAISAHIAANEAVAAKVENITAIKGVGELTAATLIAETNGFALFKSAGQLISYAGYDVIENSSGAHVGKTKISKKGNSRIRRALHMPALCVVTHKVKIFVDLYERTYERHGIKMKSYVAIQKKLLTLVYALWKKNEKFDAGYTTKEEEVVHSSRPPVLEVAA